MSSALLQWTAVLTMAVDHIGYRLFPGEDIFRMIGRIAFPLFVFLLVEGFAHTSSHRKYLARLCAFAILSEIPYKLFSRGIYWREYLRTDPVANVFYELLLVFVALWGIKLARERCRAFYGVAVLSAALAGAAGTMYGVYGVLMGIAFYIFRSRRPIAILCLAALTVLYCIEHGSAFQIYAVLAGVPIYFYNGRRGRRLPKYLAYIFYPAHLLAIYGVYCLMA